jgi:hypothetical protein
MEENTNGGNKMRGEQVIVRALGGEPLIRRVWEVFPDAIYICSEEGYEKLIAGDGWMPVGFPREDVFRYDPSMMEALLENWHSDSTVWNRLTLWKEND